MYWVGIVFATITVVAGAPKKGPCFDFPGGAYLEFKLDNFNITDRAHFRLQFRTTAVDGVMLYAEGPDDYEAVFLAAGKLHYLIANPSPSGVEGTSGGFFSSHAAVNNDTWLTLDVWRNWPMQRRVRGGGTETYTQTGIVIGAGGSVETHTDPLHRRGINISPELFIGGVRPTLRHVTVSTAPPAFQGKIREMYEERNDRILEDFYYNDSGKVKRCP